MAQRTEQGFRLDGSNRLVVALDTSTDTTTPTLGVNPAAGRTILYAKIDAASSGSNTVVAAVSLKQIVVVNYTLVAAGAVTVQWKTAAAGATLSGAMSVAANGTVSASGDVGVPLFATVAGDLLNMVLGGAVQVSGHLAYYTV